MNSFIGRLTRMVRRGSVVASALLLNLAALACQRPGPEGGESGFTGQAGLGANLAPRPSVAVLYFDNLSGDEDLEWLRSGLTDMLVTDLSQSPDIRVLSTDRLYQILADMRKLDERITSFEVVEQVASRANADTVVLGSFDKDGDTIRISIQIQEASTGEVLQAESVDAMVQEDIFARIDELSTDIRQRLQTPGESATLADRNLSEVSTDSLEAYRFFVEAEMLHLSLKDEEAIPLYERAVELDPEFAMAWAKLATAYGNQGFVEESVRHAGMAMEHLDRLSVPERAYVEGRYLGQTLETQSQAMEIYRAGLNRYPHLTALSNNLGLLYQNHWMFDEAIDTFEKGITYGDVFPGTYDSLSAAYFSTGNQERAFEVQSSFLELRPESFATYSSIAGLHIALGELDEAKEAIEQAARLRPSYVALNFNRYAIAVLEEDWAASEQILESIGELPLPFAKGARLGLQANNLIYQGRSAEALELIQPALESWDGPGRARAQVQATSALAYLGLGDPESALEYAAKARVEDPGNDADFAGHAVEILATQALDRSEEADQKLQAFSARIAPLPGNRLQCLLHEVRGRLAFERGDIEGAIKELELASELLPDFGGPSLRVWYALGEAYIEAGRASEAEPLYLRIVSMAGQRAYNPLEYVGSHYQLGKIYEQDGSTSRAKEFYAKYLDYWADGDMDREAVEKAKAVVNAS